MTISEQKPIPKHGLARFQTAVIEILEKRMEIHQQEARDAKRPDRLNEALGRYRECLSLWGAIQGLGGKP